RPSRQVCARFYRVGGPALCLLGWFFGGSAGGPHDSGEHRCQNLCSDATHGASSRIQSESMRTPRSSTRSVASGGICRKMPRDDTSSSSRLSRGSPGFTTSSIAVRYVGVCSELSSRSTLSQKSRSFSGSKQREPALLGRLRLWQCPQLAWR